MEQKPSYGEGKVENAKKDPDAGEKKMSEVFQMEDQALLYIKCPGVLEFDPCRRDPSHASASEMGSLVEKKGDVEHALQVVDYSVTGETACEHLGWTNVMMDIPRVPRE